MNENDKTVEREGDEPKRRKPYSAPKVISVEPLESTAVVCKPSTAGFGNTYPQSPCALGAGS